MHGPNDVIWKTALQRQYYEQDKKREFPSVQLTVLVATQHRCYYTPRWPAHTYLLVFEEAATPAFAAVELLGFGAEDAAGLLEAGGEGNKGSVTFIHFKKEGISYTQTQAN